VAQLIDFEGRSIRLNQERWQHISEHPEMANLRSVVEETLRLPEFVVKSLSDERARLYYRYYHRTVVGGKYCCVVVVEGLRDAFVVTAYLTDRIKRGEILWRREP